MLNHRVVLHAIEKNHPTHWLISTQAAYGGLVFQLLRRRGLAPVRERADLCARIFFNFFYDDIETRRFGLCTGANAAFVVLDHGARLVDFPAGIEALGSAARRCRGRETSKRRGGALLLLLAELRLLDEHLLYFLGHDWR